ncbi:MAG TPA: glycosyltransferase family 39 protein [Tepidisphaeraceae bacterium]|nr:glycosyltransferase family 39 protein [Tepidisphaeraceae bacterium]
MTAVPDVQPAAAAAASPPESGPSAGGPLAGGPLPPLAPPPAAGRAAPAWNLTWLTPQRCRMILVAVLLLDVYGHVNYLKHDCPIDLSGDEAQYWDWSRALDWSYYSKGPLVAYIIRASCAIFGDTMPGVRYPAVAFGVGTSLVTYFLTRRLFGSERLALGAVLLNHIVPMFVAGSVLMTIDPPMFFCWALATYFAAGAIFDAHKRAWPLIGLAIGVGFLAKYAAMLWFAGLFAFLLADAPSRKRLREPGPYVALGVSLLATIPVIAWNASHRWVSFRHVAKQTGASGGGLTRGNALEFIGSQVAVIGPVLAVMMAAAVLYAVRKRPIRAAAAAPAATAAAGTAGAATATEPPPAHHDAAATTDAGAPAPSAAAPTNGAALSNGAPLQHPVEASASAAAAPPVWLEDPYRRKLRFLVWIGLTFFGFTLVTSLFAKVQVNWPAPAYFTLMIVTAYYLGTRLRSAELWRPWRAWFWGTVLLGLITIPIAHDSARLFPLVRGVNAVLRTNLSPAKVDVLMRLRGWRLLGDHVTRQLRTLGPGAFVLNDDYMQTAETAFYVEGQPKTFYAGSWYADAKRFTQYDMWPDRRLDAPELKGRNAVYVGKGGAIPPDILKAFDKVEPLPEVPVIVRGTTVKTFKTWRCTGFKGMTRPSGPGDY